MYYPYCTINDETEVVHTPLNKDGVTVVHFETPDAVFGFKTLDCTVPGYKIMSRVGYTDEEAARLVQFCMSNAALLLTYAKTGGIANA